MDQIPQDHLIEIAKYRPRDFQRHDRSLAQVYRVVVGTEFSDDRPPRFPHCRPVAIRAGNMSQATYQFLPIVRIEYETVVAMSDKIRYAPAG